MKSSHRGPVAASQPFGRTSHLGCVPTHQTITRSSTTILSESAAVCTSSLVIDLDESRGATVHAPRSRTGRVRGMATGPRLGPQRRSRRGRWRYLAFRDSDERASFLRQNPAGTHKGKDPTISVSELKRNWITDTHVVYIGKAHLTKTSDLRRRVWAFVRQGRGGKAGHWGGRATWQLADSPSLLIAWRATDRDPRVVEREMLAAFVDIYGRLPFANLTT